MPGLPTICRLLTHREETVVGNAALCLSHLTAIPGVCTTLAETGIMMDLLSQARDRHKVQAQHNCAILIAKLCQGDGR